MVAEQARLVDLWDALLPDERDWRRPSQLSALASAAERKLLGGRRRAAGVADVSRGRGVRRRAGWTKAPRFRRACERRRRRRGERQIGGRET
jgi:hypothetical protein